jgi:hypothetical protein
MGEVEGGCMSGGGEVKRKEGEYVGGGEKNGKKKEKRNAEVWYVGGGEKRKKGREERGRGGEYTTGTEGEGGGK